MAKRQMQSPSVLVVGSSNTDLVVQSDKLPEPGMTVLGGKYQVIPGGKGANQAVAAARAGARVAFVANIGRDDFGEAALARLGREGIDTQFIVRDRRAPSGVALIMVGEKGRNLISVAVSSNDRLAKAHLLRAKAVFAGASSCLLQLETPLPTVEAALRLAKRNAARLGVETNVQFRQADGLALTTEEQVHLLVSNPPYIPTAEILELQTEVREFDPKLALDGGVDGLVFYRELAALGQALLLPGGALLAEFGDGQESAIEKLFYDARWPSVDFANDLSGKPRIVIASKGL